MNFKNFIGIDVAKDKVDIFNLGTNKHMTIANRTKNIETAFKKVEQAGSLVILENTGGYEKKCVKALTKMGFAIHKTENKSFKHYVESLGQKAKTDLLDSKALAQYGKERHEDLRLYNKTDETEEELKKLMTYLEELKRQRAAEKNRLQSPGYWGIEEIIEKSIEQRNKIIQEVENKIKELLKKSKKGNKKVESMIKYSGVSLTTAIKIMVYLPEIGTLKNKKVAALSGLVPYVRESGTKKGHMTTAGCGRPIVKRTLYMAALSAIRYNENISTFYNRLVKKGKRKMTALVACMRKMIIHLNAIVREVLKEPSLIEGLKLLNQPSSNNVTIYPSSIAKGGQS